MGAAWAPAGLWSRAMRSRWQRVRLRWISFSTAAHDLDSYLTTLKTNGQLVLVGIPD